MQTKFRMTSAACITLALLILILPFPWLLAAVLAAAFHELCHYCALRLCGSKAGSIYIGSSGASIPIPTLSYGSELLCALAGPCGSLALLLLISWLPRVALCGAFQGFYNLLPLYPLDGGRALHCGVRLLLRPNRADMVCSVVEWLCLGAVCLAALYGTVCLHLGLLPLFFAFGLLFKRQKVKIPCKAAKLRVQ